MSPRRGGVLRIDDYEAVVQSMEFYMGAPESRARSSCVFEVRHISGEQRAEEIIPRCCGAKN